MEFKKQKETFKYVWLNRNHKCEICGKIIHEPFSYCFAHVSGKGMCPKHKLDPNNIILVCSIECHHDVDKLANKKKFLINSLLEKGERVSVGILKNL